MKTLRVRLAAVVLMTLGFLSCPRDLQAETNKAVEPLALQGVMQQLGRDMQGIIGAIATENWQAVAELAPRLARDAQVPIAEKMRVLSWLGSHAGEFLEFDGDVQRAATAMQEAALQGEGQAVINAFAQVQSSCLSCHQGYRQSFIAHFYGQP